MRVCKGFSSLLSHSKENIISNQYLNDISDNRDKNYTGMEDYLFKKECILKMSNREIVKQIKLARDTSPELRKAWIQ